MCSQLSSEFDCDEIADEVGGLQRAVVNNYFIKNVNI